MQCHTHCYTQCTEYTQYNTHCMHCILSKTTKYNPLLIFSDLSTVHIYVQLPDKPMLITENATLQSDFEWSRKVSALIHYIGITVTELNYVARYLIKSRCLLMLELSNRFYNVKRKYDGLAHASQTSAQASTEASASAQAAMQYITTMINSIKIKRYTITSTECEGNNCSEIISLRLKHSTELMDKFNMERGMVLTYNEEQIHKVDKTSLDKHMNKVITLFNVHCIKSIEKTYQLILDWFSNEYKPILDNIVKLESKVNELNDDIMLKCNKVNKVNFVNPVNQVNITQQHTPSKEVILYKLIKYLATKNVKIMNDINRIQDNTSEIIDEIG